MKSWLDESLRPGAFIHRGEVIRVPKTHLKTFKLQENHKISGRAFARANPLQRPERFQAHLFQTSNGGDYNGGRREKHAERSQGIFVSQKDF